VGATSPLRVVHVTSTDLASSSPRRSELVLRGHDATAPLTARLREISFTQRRTGRHKGHKQILLAPLRLSLRRCVKLFSGTPIVSRMAHERDKAQNPAVCCISRNLG